MRGHMNIDYWTWEANNDAAGTAGAGQRIGRAPSLRTLGSLVGALRSRLGKEVAGVDYAVAAYFHAIVGWGHTGAVLNSPIAFAYG